MNPLAEAKARFALLWLVACAAACSSNGEAGPGTTDDAGGPLDGTIAAPDGGGDAAGSDAAPGDTGGSESEGDSLAEDGGSDAREGADSGALDGEAGDSSIPCPSPSGAPTPVAGPFTQDTILTCDHVYSFSGSVLVEAPATLTIQQGTTILMGAGASLIVAPHAKLVARGTREQPIVFTSAHTSSPAAGDWGAIALVGVAPGNWGLDLFGDVVTQSAPQGNTWGSFPFQAGGSAYDDSSGVLQYVRLEYGGCLDPKGCTTGSGHEILGMYGAGAGTLLDYVDIRQGLTGCIFAEGGSFSMRHVVCQRHGESGGFDFTRGNQSRAQFLLDQESAVTAGEGIGVKGPGDDNQLEPLTGPTIYNATLCGSGPGGTPHGVVLVREPAGLLYDTIVSDFYDGVAMKGGIPTPQGTGLATTQLRSSISFGNFGANIGYGAPPNDTDIPTWFRNPSWLDSTGDPGLGSCLDAKALRASPASPITASASPPPADGFFDPSATFIGAFRDRNDSWASGAWIVWSDR